MQVIPMVVSKRVDSKYVEQGKIDITVPLIADAAKHLVDAEIAKDKDGKEQIEDGIPVYVSDIANWVQSAMLAYVKMGSRNKLIPGTATLKPGLTIPTNWEELCAESDRSNNGGALRLYAECREAFAKWASTLGKSEGTVKVMTSFFNNAKALELATSEHKAKMHAYVTQFAESLEEAELERFASPIQKVLDNASSEVVDF